MEPRARSRAARGAGLGFAILLAAATGAPATPPRVTAGACPAAVQDGEPAPPESCCFVNPTYAGVCEIQPAKGETCAGILAYLNNPGSSGKTYCNSTTIRGDWRQVVCEKSPEPK
jgi:hypothetical protein